MQMAYKCVGMKHPYPLPIIRVVRCIGLQLQMIGLTHNRLAKTLPLVLVRVGGLFGLIQRELATQPVSLLERFPQRKVRQNQLLGLSQSEGGDDMETLSYIDLNELVNELKKKVDKIETENQLLKNELKIIKGQIK